ncbi:MAG: sodium:solute symporter [Lewinellaceae bacterium]|nr:sodium:solute symporter [Saprospiraceae bacterium]MCB9344404.1 sodium:solute symporter [Lewinellaceae bacterium]
MHFIDWIVLAATLAIVVFYGIWKSRNSVSGSEDFLAGKRDLPWWTIGLSIMATQASAVTFLSTPGQGYSDGMQFVQFYFGVPIAMIFLAIFVLPIYYKLRVTTAYEYLEQRFDLRMRSLTAVLFLILRGTSGAITLLAPSIILSAVFGWDLFLTNLLMAAFVVVYTVSGGNNAVSRTQELQMSVMLLGLGLALYVILDKLPPDIGLSEAWQIAGVAGKTKVLDWNFSWTDRYNVWSGVLGATFLFLSYFGTDQSQVGRYLSGKSLKESRQGLLFNGLIKIPMQFMVLAVGVMVWVFFQFNRAPLHFNQAHLDLIKDNPLEQVYQELESKDALVFDQKQVALKSLGEAFKENNETQVQALSNELRSLENQRLELKNQATEVIARVKPDDSGDKDYMFINFVLNHIPKGLVGLLLAMIFCAAWSTTASELSALAATSVSDIYRRSLVTGRSDAHYLKASKWAVALWGAFIVVFAFFASLSENLIQAVNMIGSLFYGTILGVFFTAFFLKGVKGKSVFIAAVITEIIVLIMFFGINQDAYLWYNPLGCGLVMGLGWLFQQIIFNKKKQ